MWLSVRGLIQIIAGMLVDYTVSNNLTIIEIEDTGQRFATQKGRINRSIEI